jgi:hypothetical protein
MLDSMLNVACAWRPLALLGFGAIAVACAAHMTSAVKIDGIPFVPTHCESGQHYGFAGVELADDEGRRLRLARGFDGRFQSAYFPAGSPLAESVVDCGTLDVKSGVGVVNGIRNVEGSASFRCKTPQHELVGGVRFDGCH